VLLSYRYAAHPHLKNKGVFHMQENPLRIAIGRKLLAPQTLEDWDKRQEYLTYGLDAVDNKFELLTR